MPPPSSTSCCLRTCPRRHHVQAASASAISPTQPAPMPIQAAAELERPIARKVTEAARTGPGSRPSCSSSSLPAAPARRRPSRVTGSPKLTFGKFRKTTFFVSPGLIRSIVCVRVIGCFCWIVSVTLTPVSSELPESFTSTSKPRLSPTVTVVCVDRRELRAAREHLRGLERHAVQPALGRPGGGAADALEDRRHRPRAREVAVRRRSSSRAPGPARRPRPGARPSPAPGRGRPRRRRSR